MSTPFNPVDFKIQDVLVVHSGTYVGELFSGESVSINETDLPNVKGGMFASINTNGELTICDGDTETPIGMFFGDGSRPKEVSVLIRGGVYAVKNWDTTDIANLDPGTKLIVDTNGKLKSQGVSTNDWVATCLRAPASVDDYLAIKLEI